MYWNLEKTYVIFYNKLAKKKLPTICTSTKVIKYAELRTLGLTTKICFIMNYVYLI